MKSYRLFIFALIALVCFAGLLKAQIPTLVWTQNVWFGSTSLSLHPNGKYLAVSGYEDGLNKRCAILNTDSGNIIKWYYQEVDGGKVLFSPTGKYLAFGNAGYTTDAQRYFRIYDFDADTLIWAVQKSNKDFSFHPSESKIVISGVGYIDIRRIQDGTLLDSLRFIDTVNGSLVYSSILEATYSNDGNLLVYSKIDPKSNITTLYLINLESHQILFQDNVGNKKSAVFSPDGKYMAYISSNTKGINILDLTTMEVLDSTVKQVAIDCMVFSNDSKGLFYARNNQGCAKFFNLVDKSINLIKNDSIICFEQLALSSDGKYLYNGVSSEVDKVNISTILGVEETSQINSLTLSPNPANTTLTVSFSIENTPQLIDMNIYNESGELIKEIYHGYCEGSAFNRNFEVGDLASGVYFLSVTRNGISASSTFIIAR